MRQSSDQCNHTVYLFSNAVSKQPALTPAKLRSSILSCALCSVGFWQGPSPLVTPCTAVPSGCTPGMQGAGEPQREMSGKLERAGIQEV